MNAAAEAADESDDSDDAASNENDDAVTMELTGIVPRQHEGDDDEDDNGSENSAGERGTSALPVSSSAFLSQLDPFVTAEPASSAAGGATWSPPMVSSFMDTIGSLLSTQQPADDPGSVAGAAVSALTPTPVLQDDLVYYESSEPEP
ncbi:hypothetical protein IWW52_006716, partial [Coemansia sp. RSA 2704]